MRAIITIIALCTAVAASGQIYIDSYRFAAAGDSLLDEYPSTAAAYSLRKLRTAYTGDCMVVRRSSNNDTLIIGFSGGYLDTVSLKNFCSGTDCFVRRWFDQSGEGRDATQTTSANQPQVISSGQLIRFNGNPCISIIDNSSAITQHLVVPVWHTASAANVWSFAVFGNAANTNSSVLLNSSPLDKGFLLYNSLTTYGFRGFTVRNNITYGPSNIAATVGVTYLRVDQANRSNINIWANNTAGTSSADGNVDFTLPNFYWIGNIDASANVQNNIRVIEMIFYNTDQSTNRTSIQTNINNFYSIY
jgi:hypothetical protein